jgi:diguanylate cyclase (GGDEF)-like protein/PAS domain S-box-containing protein
LNKIVDRNYKYAVKNLLSFSIIVSGAMLLSIILIMEEGLELASVISIPVILIFPVGIIGIGLVIRNRIKEVEKEKKLKKLLKEGDARYRSLFTNNHVSTLIIDPKTGQIIDANPAACSYYGYTKDEIRKLKISDINNFSEDEVRAEMNRARKEEKHHFEFKHKLKSGELRDVEVYSGPIFLDEKKYLYSIIFDITLRKERQKKIEYLSFYDQLTELYNRRFFEVEMERIDTERNLPISIIMADVNGLKLINDAFGHKYGDQLLKKSAGVLKNVCRKEDIVARVGGDEFVILLPKTESKTAYEIIDRINEETEKIKIKDLNMSIAFGTGTKTKEDESLKEIYTNSENRMYKNKLFKSSNIKGNMVSTILNTIYQSNPREKLHSNNVSILCEKMGEALNLNEEMKTDLKVSGLLHDIGKVAVNKNILNKVEKLNSKDWEEIKNHCDIGYRILSTVNNLSSIAEYILYHHERWDGEGYPKGISKKEIPYVSRILAVCNAYDAMTRDEPYRKALTKEKALKEIEENAGTQFDPNIAEVFVAEMKKYKAVI